MNETAKGFARLIPFLASEIKKDEGVMAAIVGLYGKKGNDAVNKLPAMVEEILHRDEKKETN